MWKTLIVAALLSTGAAAPPNGSAISLVIDNNLNTVSERSQASYRITVRNDSDVDYPEALVTQLLPQALSYVAADPAPERVTRNELEKVQSSEVQWITRVPAHGEVVIDLTGKVGEQVAGRTTLTTTACVLPDGKTRPLICDTDSDPLRRSPLGYIVTVLSVVGLGVVLGLMVVWRRRKARPA